MSKDMSESVKGDYEEYSPKQRDPERKIKKSEKDLSVYSKISMQVERDYSMRGRSRPRLEDVELGVFQDFTVKQTRRDKSLGKPSKIWKDGSIL